MMERAGSLGEWARLGGTQLAFDCRRLCASAVHSLRLLRIILWLAQVFILSFAFFHEMLID